MAFTKLNFIDYYICDVEADKTGQEAAWGNGAQVWVLATNAYYDVVAGAFVAKSTVQATTSGTLAQFAATTSAQLAGIISDETGSGALVFATSPTLVTPALGTPSSGVLTNCTGIPAAGSSGQIQYNASGVFGGTTPLIYDGATVSAFDSAFQFVDETDQTKKVTFSVGGSTASTTSRFITTSTVSRDYTLPNATGTFLLEANTANVTNKSLDNTNTVIIFDSLFRLQDNGDATKQGNFDVSTVSAGATRTLTWPNADGTIATLAGTETFTNKTLTSAKITTGLEPTANDGAALGTTTKQFSDLFLAEGGVINWDNGDATLTQVGDVVTLAGADLKITTPGTAATSVATIDGTQTLTNKTIAVTQLNGSAYTMAANVTNATANYTEVVLKPPGQQTYTGTITWSGTTAPSGSTNHTYNWIQVHKIVTLNISLVYSVAGTALTQLLMTLPTDCPAPLEQTGLGATTEKLYPGTGWVDSAKAGAPPSTRMWMRVNAGDTGYELVVVVASNNSLVGNITISYFTA